MSLRNIQNVNWKQPKYLLKAVKMSIGNSQNVTAKMSIGNRQVSIESSQNVYWKQ